MHPPERPGTPAPSQPPRLHLRGRAVLVAASLLTAPFPAPAQAVPPDASARYAPKWCTHPGVLDQSCIENAARGNFRGTIILGPGSYTIKSTLDIPTGVALLGAQRPPWPRYPANDGAPTLLIQVGKGATSVPAVRMHPNSAISGVRLYWPTQSQTAPVPFGWAITSTGDPSDDMVIVRNIALVNPYLGINQDFGGQWQIENVYGQPLKVGIKMDRVYDGTEIRNVHFWTFWQNQGPAYQFAQANGTCILIERVDLLNANAIECYGYRNGIDFEGSSSGAAWANISDFGIDSTSHPIIINSANLINLSDGTLSGSVTAGYGWGIQTGQNVGTHSMVLVSNVVAYALFGGADIRSATGNFSLLNFAGRAGSDNEVQQVGTSDLMGPLLVNESTADVQLTGVHADPKAVIGNLWGGPSTSINGVPFPPAHPYTAPTLFAVKANDQKSPHARPTHDGLTLELATGPAPATVTLTPTKPVPPGAYIMSLRITRDVPCIGPCQLALVLISADGDALARWPWSPFSIENLPSGTISVSLPLLLSRQTATARWTFGGGKAGRVEISQVKLTPADPSAALRSMIKGTIYSLGPPTHTPSRK